MQLTKSTYDKMLFGVCGGIAEYFGWDATLIRAAFILFTVFTIGAPLLLYILLALVMPTE
ncbi:MAG: PspC domain-containing protein [Bernardetiaceae bacterium]|nr:PspC domain-containing protein [Bernardetiaceae bacterium]